jgi:hypothetical protein
VKVGVPNNGMQSSRETRAADAERSASSIPQSSLINDTGEALRDRHPLGSSGPGRSPSSPIPSTARIPTARDDAACTEVHASERIRGMLCARVLASQDGRGGGNEVQDRAAPD